MGSSVVELIEVLSAEILVWTTAMQAHQHTDTGSNQRPVNHLPLHHPHPVFPARFQLSAFLTANQWLFLDFRCRRPYCRERQREEKRHAFPAGTLVDGLRREQ